MKSYYAFTPRHQIVAPLNEPSESAFAPTYRDITRCVLPDDGAFLRLYEQRLARIKRTLAPIYRDADLQPGGRADPAEDEWLNDAPWHLATVRDIVSPTYNALWN